MKLNIKHMIAAFTFLGMVGCDKNFEEFDIVGGGAPAAVELSTVIPEALPGQIKLSWKAPEGDYAYMQIRYYDPLQKKNVCKIASKGTTEMLIENARARFGDYTFYLQTFNAAHEAGTVQELKARSGAMPASYTEKSRAQVSLTVDQLSCNYPDASEGYFDRLIDGKTADPSFFHTNWHSPQVDLPHYIQIDLKEEHENFAFEYYTRDTGNSDGFPTSAELQISTDGEHWETVSTLTGLPTTRQTKYASDFVMPGKKFKYFRFNVLTSSQNKKYFHIGEIAFFDADIEKYDPETVPLD